MMPVSSDEIKSYIVETFLFGDQDRLSNTTPLLERHIVDSTGILEIVAFLENRYGIRIEDHELNPENLNTIDNIVRFVKMKKLPTE